jgi:DNA-binding IclR family transcriptional regulator
MAVRDGLDLVYVEREVGPSRVYIRRFVGGRGPLHCTALGKSLLAFLPDDEREAVVGELELQPFTPSTITDTDALRAELDRTRERGYAVADEEYEPGVREVGAPILGARNQPEAAISLVAASLRVSWENLERYVPSLRHAAQEITARIRDVRLPSW